MSLIFVSWCNMSHCQYAETCIECYSKLPQIETGKNGITYNMLTLSWSLIKNSYVEGMPSAKYGIFWSLTSFLSIHVSKFWEYGELIFTCNGYKAGPMTIGSKMAKSFMPFYWLTQHGRASHLELLNEGIICFGMTISNMTTQLVDSHGYPDRNLRIEGCKLPLRFGCNGCINVALAGFSIYRWSLLWSIIPNDLSSWWFSGFIQPAWKFWGTIKRDGGKVSKWNSIWLCLGHTSLCS